MVKINKSIKFLCLDVVDPMNEQAVRKLSYRATTSINKNTKLIEFSFCEILKTLVLVLHV